MTNKRERILNAAEHLIANLGFQGMSMQLVAREAGVATGTIYRYFRDKESLLRCVHEERMQEGVCGPAAGRQHAGPQPGAVSPAVAELPALPAEQPRLSVVPRAVRSLSLFSREEEERMDERYFKPVFEFFERGRDIGLFRDLPSDLLGFLALENLMLLTQRHARGCIQMNEAVFDELMDAAWNAILKR
ncbi:TetR/AcrR family transcriptional regulator [Oceanimonas sp. NS1]|nr:TetR/AcrR family transcriptional regulator [Oceanimonas sp. NS1]